LKAFLTLASNVIVLSAARGPGRRFGWSQSRKRKDDDDDHDGNNNNKGTTKTVILGTAHLIRKVLTYKYETYFTYEITLDVHKM
jgi:hypothetical protein